MVIQNLVQASNLFNYTSFSYFFFLFGFSYLNKLKKWSLVNSCLFESSRIFKTTSRIKTTNTILITQYKTMAYSSSVTRHNFFHEFFFGEFSHVEAFFKKTVFRIFKKILRKTSAMKTTFCKVAPLTYNFTENVSIIGVLLKFL